MFENLITNNKITSPFDKLIEMYTIFFNLVKNKVKDENIMINTDKFLNF